MWYLVSSRINFHSKQMEVSKGLCRYLSLMFAFLKGLEAEQLYNWGSSIEHYLRYFQPPFQQVTTIVY